jgi:hypothetical protein
MDRTVTDALTATHAVLANVGITRFVAQSLTTSDAILRLASGLQRPNDILQLTDTLLARIAVSRALSDTAKLAEVSIGKLQIPFVGWGVPV